MEKLDIKRLRKSYVPEELVREILLRLPVKSLVRFKGVCKSWSSLITSFDFIKNHYLVFHKNNNNTHILVYDYPKLPSVSVFVNAFSYESLSNNHQYLDYIRIPQLTSHEYKLHGPVHGLFLLSLNNQVILFNPATRELTTVLVPDTNQQQLITLGQPRLGFGFDPLTNDVKVVSVRNVVETNETDLTTEKMIGVYSLASNSWKHLDTFQSTHRCKADYNSCYLNGVCYWLLTKFIHGDSYSILSFDLASEVVREIKGPEDTVSKNKKATLFLYNNEFLGMFLCKRRNNFLNLVDSFDLLVMKEEGCWTKLVSVDLSVLQVNVRKLLGVWKDNILLERLYNLDWKRLNPSLVLYDLSSHKFKELETSNMFYFYPEVFSYKESLISVVKDGENYNKWPDLSLLCLPKN